MADHLREFRNRQGAYLARYAPGLVRRAAVAAPAGVPLDVPIVANQLGERTLPRTLSRWWHGRRGELGLEGWTLNDLRRAATAVIDADGEDWARSRYAAMTGRPILPPFPEGGCDHGQDPGIRLHRPA